MSSAPPPPVCFLRGTRVATPAGERPVEDLSIGDEVVTADGASRPVKWIGRMTFRRAGVRWVEKVRPVRVARGTLGDGLPRRDLYLSRKHCLLIDDVLVPVKYLVNGHSITLSDMAGTDLLEYFHLELDSHDAVLAEGVPAETLCRNGRNIESFDNFAEHFRLYPGEAAEAVLPFAAVLRQTGFNKAVAKFGPAVAAMLARRGRIEEIRDRIAALSTASA